jgi:hypothetical protein
MQIPNFQPFIGQHCETTATGCLLCQIGIELTEPMLFGLGEGLSFIYWKMKSMDFPFLGGRIKTDLLTQNICRNLNLTLNAIETSSIKKAWSNVSDLIANGIAVGLKLDCFHLDYFTSKIHFAGHYVALYGYDHKDAYLIDTDQQGGRVKTSLASLALARNEKGPMSSRNLSYTIARNGQHPELKSVIKSAIFQNAREYLNPPIKNISYQGIIKASRAIKAWYNTSPNRKRDFQTMALLMERAGTGGALFRNLYRDFLAEAAELTSMPELQLAAAQFRNIAKQWTTVAECLDAGGETSNAVHIDQAAEILADLAVQEKLVMEELLRTCQSNF